MASRSAPSRGGGGYSTGAAGTTTGQSQRGGGGVVRPQTSSQQRGQQRPQPPLMTYNKCQKPLTTTLFVVACNCVFCVDCTYDHFGADSNCPCCRKEATEEDFMELHIADPSMDKSAKKETATCFQNMFTKHSTSARAVSQADAVRHLMKSVDDNSRMMRFLVKQLVMASTSHGARSVENGRACARFKDELTKVKQAMNSMKISSDGKLQDAEKRIHAHEVTIKEHLETINELQIRNEQLQELAANECKKYTPPPSSSHSNHSGSAGGGKRGPGFSSGASVAGGGGHRHHNGRNGGHRNSSSQGYAGGAAPPLQNITIQQQQQQQQRHRDRSIAASRGDGVYVGRPVTGASLAPTPIVQPPPSQYNRHRPMSTGTALTTGTGFGGGDDGVSAYSDGSRDYTTGAGFKYNHHGKRQRSGSGGMAGQASSYGGGGGYSFGGGRSNGSGGGVGKSRGGGSYQPRGGGFGRR